MRGVVSKAVREAPSRLPRCTWTMKWEDERGKRKPQPNIKVEKAVRRFKTCRVPKICRAPFPFTYLHSSSPIPQILTGPSQFLTDPSYFSLLFSLIPLLLPTRPPSIRVLSSQPVSSLPPSLLLLPLPQARLVIVTGPASSSPVPDSGPACHCGWSRLLLLLLLVHPLLLARLAIVAGPASLWYPPFYWGGPCSGCWFLVRFSDLILGCQDNGFIQERGVVAGTRVGVVILVPVFLGALVAVFLVVLVFFRALSWLQFRAWTGVGFLRGRLVVFFVAVLVGPFVAVLVVVLLFAFV